MFRRKKQLTLGVWLLLVLLLLGIFAIRLLFSTTLLWRSIATQGVIVNKQAVSCGKSV